MRRRRSLSPGAAVTSVDRHKIGVNVASAGWFPGRQRKTLKERWREEETTDGEIEGRNGTNSGGKEDKDGKKKEWKE